MDLPKLNLTEQPSGAVRLMPFPAPVAHASSVSLVAH
jgi:hypothetical protein